MSEINKETMNDIIKVSSSSETENFEDAVDEAGMQLDVEPEKKIKTDQEMQEEIQVEQVDEKMIEVNVFINAAPEIIQVPNKLTIAELKTEINKKFNVDFDEHRWVIGELLPADELITLEALQVSPIPISISLFRLNDNLKPVEADKNEVDEMIQNQYAEADNLDTLVIVEGERDCFELDEACALPEPKITKIKKDDSEYKELMKLEDYEAVPNLNAFECPICFDFYEPFQGVVLRDCLHSFCRECIESNVKLNDDFEVKCPYADNRYACQSILQEREIKALLGKDLYDKHLEKSLKYAALTSPESFNCRAADCDYWFLRDNDLNHFLCPKCEKTNCLTCEVIHEGRTCFEYQDDLVIANNPDEAKRRTTEQLENMIKTKKAMPCPKCGIILTKVDGCDGMKCTVCKTAICWATRGPRWGPEGQGDRSGGCKCEPYAKCHPDCHNCH
ncbi:ranBP-type and C3HC4-type zinc finger-containing protein 1-like [Cotesia typhae]|uniref:ranBP-type and C3HC4-type zinc finger-containing protein 1-like n=1 Tax=Cotesia typhae TaxID=2053667 RepID=UPI003D69D4B0